MSLPPAQLTFLLASLRHLFINNNNDNNNNSDMKIVIFLHLQELTL